jgi:hypothetical protein
MSDKVMNDLGSEWTVEWATPKPHDDGVLDTLVLSREKASEYGDELVQSLRVDGEILRRWGLDPNEPFAWMVKDGEIVTKQISRQLFERVAESERDDAYYARETLKYRAERCLRQSSSYR